RGSLGVDLAAAVNITLKDSTVHKIPTGVFGLVVEVDSSFGALLLGRSSTGLAVLIVLPGVIDADYTGEIIICAYTLFHTLTIKAGQRIAQLMFIDKPAGEEIHTRPYRKDCGFGSTGETVVNFVQQMKLWTMVTITMLNDIEAHQITAVMDTGTDVTIIS
ncbi:POK9 protein, partial [Geococcyx californianus]|nr:POK9 protein [Geococcyx californianus]